VAQETLKFLSVYLQWRAIRRWGDLLKAVLNKYGKVKSKVYLLVAMKAYGEWKYGSSHS